MRETDESFKKASEAMDLAVKEYAEKSNKLREELSISGNDLTSEAHRRNMSIALSSINNTDKIEINRKWTNEM